MRKVKPKVPGLVRSLSRYRLLVSNLVDFQHWEARRTEAERHAACDVKESYRKRGPTQAARCLK